MDDTQKTSSEESSSKPQRPRTEIGVTTIRFAGDSGDGMQLVGSRFASSSAILGDDVVTLAEFPSEIRAPAGTVFGVSGFQLSLGSEDVFTPGDDYDVLVAMNPAALKANLANVKKGGIIITNADAFGDKNLEKAGYAKNPLDSGELAAFRVFPVEVSRLTEAALKDLNLPREQVGRSRNFFALGLISWLYNRSLDSSENWIRKKFKNEPDTVAANLRALQGGHRYGDNHELFTTGYILKKSKTSKKPGHYRYISGNSAVALGLIAAAERAKLRLFLGSYPITPATDILHELSRHRQFPITTFQAEDEIAAIGSAIGASFAGALAVTTTSGPGMALKTEFINLAVMTELPLVIVNVQRGGPSTGIPTKMEQADLFQALWSRNGESPIVVLAARSPQDCFYITMEAAAIALKYMTPVIVLSDGYIANGSEPWRIPEEGELPDLTVKFHTDPSTYKSYSRNPETLARPWAIPGTKGLEHRIGGLEKQDVTGAVDQSSANHGKMVKLRDEKIARVANDYPPLKIHGDPNAELLVLGWGSSYGAIMQAVNKLQAAGKSVACLNLRHLNPFPKDLKGILEKFPKVLVAENNLGQLWTKIRAEYLVNAQRYNKLTCAPFRTDEIEEAILKTLGAST